MERNNMTAGNARKLAKLQNTCGNKSNAVHALFYDDFSQFDSIDPDVFTNVIDDTPVHIQDQDTQEE